jgi:hypothetical protein
MPREMELDSLDFPAELAKANSPIEALEGIRTTIARVITQCPGRYRVEKHRLPPTFDPRRTLRSGSHSESGR